MDFIIGGLAGVGATVLTNPMDVVKTRMQLQGELRARSETAPRYKNMFNAVYVIARADGAAALQKGLMPALWIGFGMNSVRLGTYHVAEVQGLTKTPSGETSTGRRVLWSALSGVLGGAVTNPVFVLKTRIQAAAHPSIAVGKQYTYKGMWDGTKSIYRNDGIRGFFAGVSATCYRVAIGSAAQLTSFSLAKEALVAHGVCARGGAWLPVCASAAGGLALTLVLCPLEVASIRLYNQV